MITPHTTVDSREFSQGLKEYMKFTKKAVGDVINTKAYFVARNAVNTTDTVDAAKAESELRQQAKIADAPLAAILANKRRGAGGQKGLNGAKMNAAVNKLIKARKRTVNFLRAGWIPAIKALENFIEKKAGAPKFKKVKTFGSPKGGGTAGKPTANWRAFAEIWNTVTGGKKRPGIESKSSPTKVANTLENGLQKALNQELKSMQTYLEKKMNEGAKIINGR